MAATMRDVNQFLGRFIAIAEEISFDNNSPYLLEMVLSSNTTDEGADVLLLNPSVSSKAGFLKDLYATCKSNVAIDDNAIVGFILHVNSYSFKPGAKRPLTNGATVQALNQRIDSKHLDGVRKETIVLVVAIAKCGSWWSETKTQDGISFPKSTRFFNSIEHGHKWIGIDPDVTPSHPVPSMN